MTAAVGSTPASPYVAPPAAVPSLPSGDSAAAASSSAAAPLPAGSAPLSDGTVAALVAQQASDASSSASSSASTSSSASASTADHAQIPQAVLDNMKAFQTTSATAYTDQINQYASTINDAKASDQDRLNAWTALTGMLTSGTVYQAGNVADLQTAMDATQTSGYAKSLIQLENHFASVNTTAVSVAKAKGEAGAQGMVDALNSFSDADQQKIFVLMGLNQTYSDVATLKADDQNIADIYAKTGQLTKATMQLGQPGSGSGAKPAATAAGSSPASQGQWDYGALNQAVAAVNDTSGKTSRSDQLAAYQLLSNYANTGQDVGDTRKAIVNSFLQSPVTAQVQATLNKFSASASLDHGTSFAEATQKRLSAFNSLSSDEQAMLYAGQGSTSYASQAQFAASFQDQAAAASSADPGGAQALKTLQSISDQMAAARKGDDNTSIASLFDSKPATGKGAAGPAGDSPKTNGAAAAA